MTKAPKRGLFCVLPFRKKNSTLLQHMVFYLYNMR